MYTFREFSISDHMMGVIDRYVNEGCQPGRFLTAIICNDLKEAVGQADDINLRNIPAFVAYFYNETPGNCWGSKKRMEEWIEKFKGERIIDEVA